MSERKQTKRQQPRFKLIEIGRCVDGEESTDFLIVGESTSAADVLSGDDGIHAQAADRLMGEIIVKALNCYPAMHEALKAVEPFNQVPVTSAFRTTLPSSTRDAFDEAFVKLGAALALSEGRAA